MAAKNDMRVITVFPPNVPQELISEYRKIITEYAALGGYQRKLARYLNVNMKYLNDLLIRGVEPTTKTAKGREARQKLFLKNESPITNKEEVREMLQGLIEHLQDVQRRLNE